MRPSPVFSRSPPMKFLKCSLAVSLLIGSGPASAGDWNQWRGPNRDGGAPETEIHWPDTLEAGNLTKLWEAKLAEGYASPIVA